MTDQRKNRTGKVFRTLKDGLPILWTLVPEMPSGDVRSALSWLVVISWKYDGSANNGMPQDQVNDEMLKFELALATLEGPNSCFEAYRRIGNHLREFVLYIADRDDFIAAFNDRLAEHPRYPIDIKFYQDKSWSELQELIDDLCPSSGVKVTH